MTYLLKKGRAEKQLFAWQKKGKRQPAREKAPRINKKDRLLHTPGVEAEGRDDDNDGEDKWEPVVPITSPSDSVSVSEG